MASLDQDPNALRVQPGEGGEEVMLDVDVGARGLVQGHVEAAEEVGERHADLGVGEVHADAAARAAAEVDEEPVEALLVLALLFGAAIGAGVGAGVSGLVAVAEPALGLELLRLREDVRLVVDEQRRHAHRRPGRDDPVAEGERGVGQDSLQARADAGGDSVALGHDGGQVGELFEDSEWWHVVLIRYG